MSIERKTSSPSITATKRILMASTVALALAGGIIAQPIFATPSYAEAVKINAPEIPGFGDVVDAVSPAVVSVRVEAEIQPAVNRQGFSDDDFPFDRRFGNNEQFREWFFGRKGQRGQRGQRGYDRKPHKRFGMSQGSGFFVSEDGYLVTNNHVVENGSKFTVVLNDGVELSAKLIGTDPKTDLAVLKVDADKKFTYVAFGEKEPRIGDWVVAVGNPFGLGGTVTAGIISAHNREISDNSYDDYIQIDAAVNKGNSGGPAFDLNGNVIGINTAIFSPSGGNVGIAFAIPAATAKQIVNDLIDDGHVVRGWLGVQIQPVSDEIAESLGLAKAEGAIVAEPQEGSPAAKAGVKAGDVIVAVNDKDVKSPKTLARIIGSTSPDSAVTLKVWRNGKQQDLAVTLGKMKGAELASLKSDEKPEAATLEGIGIKVQKGEDGLVVSDLDQDGIAAEKGIRPGDVLKSVNGETITKADDVSRIMAEAKKLGRSNVLFQISRDGASQFLPIPLEAS